MSMKVNTSVSLNLKNVENFKMKKRRYIDFRRKIIEVDSVKLCSSYSDINGEVDIVQEQGEDNEETVQIINVTKLNELEKDH